MARRKAEPASAVAPEPIGHNSKLELTDEQKQALFFSWMKEYEAALEEKKQADAKLKNVCKKSKAEGVLAKDIKFAIQLRDNYADMEAERAERERIASWMRVPFGTQADMFDRMPSDEKAEKDGFEAGSKGLSRKSPYEGRLESEWLNGWTRGQKALQDSLSLFKSREEDAVAEEAMAEGDAFDEALD